MQKPIPSILRSNGSEKQEDYSRLTFFGAKVCKTFENVRKILRSTLIFLPQFMRELWRT